MIYFISYCHLSLLIVLYVEHKLKTINIDLFKQAIKYMPLLFWYFISFIIVPIMFFYALEYYIKKVIKWKTNRKIKKDKL